MSAPLDSYHGHLQQIEETTITSRSEAEARAAKREYLRRWKLESWSDSLLLRSILRTPFSGGTISLTHSPPDHFSRREALILERFAEAFSLGYARYQDFRSMDRRNRELEVERAVGRVQITVQNMKSSADIVLVMPLLYEEMQRLGLDYDYLSVSIVDQEKKRVQVYVLGGFLHLILVEEPDTFGLEVLGPQIVERLESEEGPFCFANLAADQKDLYVHCISAPLNSYHGRLQQIDETTIASRSDEELRALMPELARSWKAENWPEEYWPRSTLRVPFAGGTIALVDTHPDHFGEREALILERFAEAFALGYTRYLDFRLLEDQNEALTAASRIKSEFLANMSHELRTPMNAIINFSSMVLDGVCGEITDERRLTQHVLINLVKNAIKFTHAGQIECGARPDNGDVLFWVADTGIGIAPDEQERIFETFHQVDSSITRQAEGSGLGLAIAQKFVELHRGRIWVESEEGKGSTFYFTIPAAT